MAQIKIFGIKENLAPIRERLSEVIHEYVMKDELIQYQLISIPKPVP